MAGSGCSFRGLSAAALRSPRGLQTAGEVRRGEVRRMVAMAPPQNIAFESICVVLKMRSPSGLVATAIEIVFNMALVQPLL